VPRAGDAVENDPGDVDATFERFEAVLPGPSNRPITPSTIEMSAGRDASRLTVAFESIHRSRFLDATPVTAVCQVGSM
jgi:hypothetical protein